MSLIITSPKKSVNGLLTDVLAIESQALYPTAREDIQINDINYSAPNTVVITTGAATFINDGDTVYIQEDTGNIPAGVYKVLTVGGGGNNVLTLDSNVYTGSLLPSSGYVNNLDRLGYNIAVEIRDAADTFTVLDTTYRFVPPQNGFINIDLQNPINFYLKDTETLSFQYFARFTEVWEGSSNSPIGTDTIQAVGAYKQIGLLGGALYWESLLRPTGTATDNTLGKFLTGFINPVVWLGWNRTASFVVDNEIASRLSPDTGLRLNYFGLNVNKTLVSGAPADNYSFSPVRVEIVGISDKVDVIAANAQNKYTRLYMSATPINAQISEDLDFEMREECQNPIMLDWLNIEGGVDQWLFTINQVIDIDVDEGIVTERPINGDFQDVTRTKRRFKGPTVQRMTLYADDLTLDQLTELREIKETESLRVYLTKDGTEFVDAIVTESFSDTYETKDKAYSFSVVIEFPDDYDFYKAKKY